MAYTPGYVSPQRPFHTGTLWLEKHIVGHPPEHEWQSGGVKLAVTCDVDNVGMELAAQVERMYRMLTCPQRVKVDGMHARPIVDFHVRKVL